MPFSTSKNSIADVYMLIFLHIIETVAEVQPMKMVGADVYLRADCLELRISHFRTFILSMSATV